MLTDKQICQLQMFQKRPRFYDPIDEFEATALLAKADLIDLFEIVSNCYCVSICKPIISMLRDRSDERYAHLRENDEAFSDKVLFSAVLKLAEIKYSISSVVFYRFTPEEIARLAKASNEVTGRLFGICERPSCTIRS